MTTYTALIVDDEPDIRELLEITLTRMGITTLTAPDVTSARALLEQNTTHLCLTDMNLPDGNGIELVQWIQKHSPATPVAVITAYGNMDTAIESLKAGAFDFVSKPVELPRLRELVNSALKLAEPKADAEEADDEPGLLLGKSPEIRKLRNQTRKLARSQAPVFISGESGSGKELVARMIHLQGPRREGPFVAVNCGAIPSELMESEFFGHKRGSFTGASADKDGFFKAAEGGTLFLDEVAELPLDMQAKLLRVIQEKATRAVGSEHESPIDVRILSASHKDLAKMVEEERFRQDLFFRLDVIQIAVPRLRERQEDIPTLINHFIRKYSREWGMPEASVGRDAMAALMDYNYPGNVRELENILQRAVTMAEGDEINQLDLNLPVHDKDPATRLLMPAIDPAAAIETSNLEDYLENIERSAITQALEATRWNKTAAAEKLGISFRALRYRCKKLDID
jgi:two-component system response regulator PilR (NtrC family)